MDLHQLRQSAFEEIKQTSNLEKLEEIRLRYLGRKGKLTKILRSLKDLQDDQRVSVGKFANELKTKISKEIEAKKRELKTEGLAVLQEKEWIDVTLPDLKGITQQIGHLHPISKIQEEVEDIFISMGFMVLDGPELESDYYNFEALNFPKDHPARDIQDTFYIAPEQNNLVLRTHTSSVQVRAMEKYGVPLRAIVPGRVFRYEATDASHDTTFYQVEGFMIDKDVNLAHLKAVVKGFLDKIFHKKIKLRFRPGYFPFTEPSLELDLSCLVCGGKGCRVCKWSGWVEFMGAGMIHPNVLKNGGINPNKYSSFAFGFSLDRLAMMKYRIDDIRWFHSGDLRFLEQF